MSAEDDKQAAVGYRAPPLSTRFRKGQSGNPKGRPRGSRPAPPHDTVLGQKVTIREGGIARRITAAEAFLLHMAKRGLEGDSAAARTALEAIAEARAARGPEIDDDTLVVVLRHVAPGGVESAMRPLGMATRLDPYRPTTRLVIEPWLVELALERLGERRLTAAQQREIVHATRTPRKVKWPTWWTERP
jgi:hypothetical protein